MTLRNIKLFIVAFAVIIILGLIALLFIRQKLNLSGTVANRATVIKQIQSLSRLETASFTIEKIIDAGTSGDNVFQRLLFGDKILLIAHGEAIAGFDLSQVTDKDIRLDGKKLNINLSAPELLSVTLDNTKTRVYDRQRGLLAANSNDLETQARIAAEKSIREAACEGGILQIASDNARKQLTASFTSLGFESVAIDIPSASCQ